MSKNRQMKEYFVNEVKNKSVLDELSETVAKTIHMELGFQKPDMEIMERTREKNKDKLHIIGGKLIHKRTAQQTLHLWNVFKDKYADTYCMEMGYSVEDIERIGIDKFFDMWDWVTEDDIESYKTSYLKVVICVHCKNEFAIYNHLSLCNQCVNLYSESKVALLTTSLLIENGEAFEDYKLEDAIFDTNLLFAYSGETFRKKLFKKIPTVV